MHLKKYLFLLLLIMSVLLVKAQQPDSLQVMLDTFPAKDTVVQKDTVAKQLQPVAKMHINWMDSVLSKHRFIDIQSAPVSMTMIEKKKSFVDDAFFYIIVFLFIYLAFLKFFYDRYFSNLFRVFFNTTLKQSQLTDQLLQSKLPSMLFNIFFVLSFGLYGYFLMRYYGWVKQDDPFEVIGLSALAIMIIYMVKYVVLKITGWMVGFRDVTDAYIFIVFLINKILGVFLLPITLLIVFGSKYFIDEVILISLILSGAFLLMRFFRSYGNLQGRIKVSRFHFLLYLVGIEILPLLLLYKSLMIILTKKL